MEKIVALKMETIERPHFGIRLDINPNEVRELADSIKEQGLLQPILVRKNGTKYEVVAGDRRFLAHELLGLKTINSIVRELNDQDCFLIRAIENLQRVDLSPLEEGAIYREMIDKYKMTIKATAKAVAVSESTVISRLKMLEMPEYIQRALHEKRVAMGPIETLYRIEDVSTRDMYLKSAVENGITERTAMGWYNDYLRTTEGRQLTPHQLREMEYQDLKRKHFSACDICEEPVESMKLKALCICESCLKTIITGGKE